MADEKKIALFIDADNIPAKYGKLIIESLQKRGEIFIRRIYGNWEKNSLHGWNESILKFGLNAVQQMDFTVGKNATDMSLTIDAMEVLYQRQATIFAIVSGDSDFTPLAVKLRERGVYVVGLGKEQASNSFRSACNEFIDLNSLDSEKLNSQNSSDLNKVSSKISAEKKSVVRKISSTKKIPATKNISTNKKVAVKKFSAEKNSIAKKVPTAKKFSVAKKNFSTARKISVAEKKLSGEIKNLKVHSEKISATKKIDGLKVELGSKKNSALIAAEKNISTIKKPAPVTKIFSVPNNLQISSKKIPLSDRFVKCGQNGMRKPKKKLQQIHDVLHESAKFHADSKGFAPLNCAGHDLKQKNLGFGIKDFGYSLLHEFIGDFPDLYELIRTKSGGRSFRYRCL